jgi:sugar O-acyltransferase (sialic acid O-acetyltransferase NeuD family)
VAWLIDSCPGFRSSCFVDDNEAHQGQVLNGYPVLSLATARERFPGARVVGAIGSPRAREVVMGKAAAAGFTPATIIHPRVEMSRWVTVGEGTVICAGSILTTNIELGRHVQINIDCTVGHDAMLDDYATLAPGVHISGSVRLGKRSYVGTGAVVINGTPEKPLIIGDGAVVGAGACVTKSVDPGATVVGVPAKPLARV